MRQVGQWDDQLFMRFRRARTQWERRALLSELLRVNAPLVKLLVGQLSGQADEKNGSRKRRPTRMRVVGAAELPWEDLMQAGFLGFAHALGKFNPAKGKISGYARWWILTNLQRLVKKEAFVRTPDHETALSVLLECQLDADDDREGGPGSGRGELERLAAAAQVDEEPSLSAGHSLAELAAWEKAGTWPAGFEDVRANYLHLCPRVAYSIARPPMDVFLERYCVIGRRADRAPVLPMWDVWRLECRIDRREEGTRGELLAALVRRGAKPVDVRYRGHRYRGVTHVRLATPLTA
jgi:hypothetical protein